MISRRFFLTLPALAIASFASAETAIVAVATNFKATARAVETAFENAGSHEITLITGASGKLYAQILNGAPFDVFLSADRLRPSRLVEEGHALENSQFTYARGRLTLWSQDKDAVKTLHGEPPDITGLRKIAIANPELAPYGLAARQTLKSMGQWDAASTKIVMGENVGQVYAMVATGNAHSGFVAFTALLETGITSGSRWDVPPALHTTIRQDAVLLARGDNNAAARAFINFLVGPTARSIIQAHGYELD